MQCDNLGRTNLKQKAYLTSFLKTFILYNLLFQFLPAALFKACQLHLQCSFVYSKAAKLKIINSIRFFLKY